MGTANGRKVRLSACGHLQLHRVARMKGGMVRRSRPKLSRRNVGILLNKLLQITTGDLRKRAVFFQE